LKKFGFDRANYFFSEKARYTKNMRNVLFFMGKRTIAAADDFSYQRDISY